MILTLAMKEFRDCIGITTIAACLFAWVIASQIGVPIAYWSRPIVRFNVPFVGDDFYQYFLAASVGLAVALGIWQVTRESSQRTYDLLFLLPLSRSTIFVVKMVVGLLLTLGVSGAALLAYAIWAGTPGMTPTPFRWYMAAPCWSVWAALPAVYLGAFLTALRPGRWFGTRLLPLAGAGFLAALISNAVLEHWRWGLISLVLCMFVLFEAITYYECARDY